MKKTWLAPAIALGLLAAAAPARAQSTYCYGGQLWTCFSYKLSAVANVSGGTDVHLSIRNLSTAAPGGQGSWLTAFAIYSPSDVGVGSGMNVTTTGTVGIHGSPGPQWNFTSGAMALGLPGALELASSGELFGGPKNGAIIGCGTPGGTSIYFSTCAPTNTGWVVFNFHTTGSWATQTNQFVMGVKWQTTQGSFECTTGAPSRSTPSCGTSTVPEPITMTLLATGLAGMGGAGLLRRRKKDEELGE